MPIPAYQWKLKPIVPPGRNDPCWCGSGDKFKACCEELVSRPFLTINMLRFVLDACSLQQLKELASTGRASLEAVANTAGQWIEEGQSERAVALLEPFFEAPRTLPSTLSPLFDELMSGLLKEKRQDLRFYWIDEVLARGDSAFKSAALQQRAVMHCDEGAFEACWADFAQAQHFNPNDPSLASLEVSLLMGQNRTQQAAERAAWWAQHLSKLREPSYAQLIENLQSFSKRPIQSMMDMAAELVPGLAPLLKLVQTAPAPALMHTLKVRNGMPDPAEAALTPMALVLANESLQKLENQWRACFVQAKPMLVATQNDAPEVWDNVDDWLGLLQHSPALLNSFDVLDDLVMAVDALDMAIGSDILVLLAERAAELLRLLLEAQTTPVRVPWVIQENRVVLRPIAHLAYVCKDTGKWDRFMELASWLVLELNPNDNHGLRWDLSQAYMLHGRDRDALKLNDLYPHDSSPVLDMNRVLAYYRLADLAQAKEALLKASLDHPKALTMLLKPRPRPVKHEDLGITVGGTYEAWLYVQPHQPLWQASGALVWAQEVLKK
ncbi:MAG: SEC-C domain-containing protein [Rhodoferax sp.]|nr:SEC-C domain-containing protein [Rhodoferax sp.]